MLTKKNITYDLKIYFILRRILNLPLTRDLISPLICTLMFKPNIRWSMIQDLIMGKRVIIVGAGPNVLDDIDMYLKMKSPDDVIISSDGATKALLERRLYPHIVVTDLDGDPESLTKAYREGSHFIVLCHGDNIDKIKYYRDILENVFVTSQVYSLPPYILELGGFTDGDRAVHIATRFNAREIILVGMNFHAKIGGYSLGFPKDLKIKKVKLRIASVLTENLRERHEISYLKELNFNRFFKGDEHKL